MPIPYTVARLNRVGLNRVMRHVSPYMPGHGVVVHRGRRSGREYRTPVMVFPHGERYVIALTYGRGTDWEKNVLAAGAFSLEVRGHRVQLTEPHVYHDESRAAVNPVVRRALGVLGVADFLEARRG